MKLNERPSQGKEQDMDTEESDVAAGKVGHAAAPGPDYRVLDALIGRWMTTGHSFGPDGAPPTPIAASDIYEWAPGGFFILHTAYGTIGEHGVGGIEMIGFDTETGRFSTAFYDSQGNVTREQLSVEGTTWSWVGTEVRSTGTLEHDGQKLVCHHERRDGETWVPSMDVTLTRVD
jgi:Protein of unknown function (DUF1579)